MNLFQGRVSRSTFFLSLVSLQILIFLLAKFGIPIIMLFRSDILEILLKSGVVVFTFYLLLVIVGLHAKRWHDIGKSGWFAIVSLIPLIGSVITVILFFIPGSSKKNKYGEKPVSIRF